eukprot:TRINITY_DN2587_c0_g2_i1.p2 TRINITY_DN2587_c0_g2~~TRINITY_DN2587_c0_g2_i1.p2  ORF type:complete len:510 (-),score=73.18 TRINITY_DN2587_c0_g2_i1:1021-2550(-)
MLQPGDYMTKIDLKDGFFHLEIPERDRTYFGFQWRGEYYVYNVFGFGCNVTPHTFCKMLRPVIEHLRSLGVRILAYMDDFIILGRTRAECLHSTHLTLEALRHLGWHVKASKSHLEPTQRLEFLGLEVDCTGPLPMLRVPYKKRKNLKHEISRLLAVQGPVPARHLARVLGLCVSLTRAVIPARRFLRQAFACLSQKSSWNSTIWLTKGARENLLWWQDALKTWNGKTVLPLPPDTTFETDASEAGWGAVFEHTHLRGTWSPQEARQSSNYRELSAVLRSLIQLKERLRGKTVLLRSDNSSTVAYINNFGGKIDNLDVVAEQIRVLCLEHNIILSAKHLPGLDNIIPDRLSRQVDWGDWQLSPNAFERLDSKWGPHHVDRFASRTSTHLPRYNSRWWEAEAEAVDAIQQDWSRDNNLLVPPWPFIHRCLRKVRDDHAQATIILPVWPAQPWYPLLLSLLVDPPTPLRQRDFLPGHSGHVEPWNNNKWQVAAYRISGASLQLAGDPKMPL